MSLEALVIYDSVLFNRTGQVRRWAESLNRRFVANAKVAAPMRSGELVAGIHGEVARIGPRHLQTLIYSEAPHSLWVLGGTYGPITSDRPVTITDEGEVKIPHMRLRPGNGYGVLFRTAVSGQRANNFFADAAAATARVHSSLRGFSPTYNGF